MLDGHRLKQDGISSRFYLDLRGDGTAMVQGLGRTARCGARSAGPVRRLNGEAPGGARFIVPDAG